MVCVLAVSDRVDERLYADLSAARRAELILACGGLPADYLGYLASTLAVPLVYVPGPEDDAEQLAAELPDAFDARGRVVTVRGLRVAGWGPALEAGTGVRPGWSAPHRWLRRSSWRQRAVSGGGGRVDVLLAPSGPSATAELAVAVNALRPHLLLHGGPTMMAPSAGVAAAGPTGSTAIRSANGRHLFYLAAAGESPAATAHLQHPAGGNPAHARGVS